MSRTDPVVAQIDEHLEAIERIDVAADGRSLTKNQADQRAAHVDAARELVEIAYVADGATRTSGWTEYMARQAASTGAPNDIAKARKSIRADRLQVEGAIARGETDERVERAAASMSATEGSVAAALRAFVRTNREQVVDFSDSWPAGVQYRALQSAGGSAVPTEFTGLFEMFERTMTPMLSPDVVRVIETPDGHPIVVSRLTADPNHGGTVTAEAAGINETESTISAITLGTFKYGVTQIYSRELADDNAVDLERRLAFSSARELSIDLGAHLTTGTGTVQPFGIVDRATAGYTATGTASGTSADTFFSPADLLELWYSLPAPYRKSPTAGFMVSTGALAKIRKFKSTAGEFLWQPDLNGNETFAGIRLVENPAMASVASATKSVVAGDLAEYYSRKVPLRVEISRDYKFNTDQIALRTIYRVDGNLPDVAGVRSLISANT